MASGSDQKGLSLDHMASYYDIMTPAETSRMRKRQISYLNLKPGEKVLDVGCGTGSLTVLAKMGVGEKAEVCGIDIAPKMLKAAQQKAERYKLSVDFMQTSIDELPWLDEHFDVIISSLMFHHLPLPVKKSGLKELHRVLKKDGRFLLSDFCTPTLLSAPFMAIMFLWMAPTRYQFLGKLPALIKECGFSKIELVKTGFFIKHYVLRK